jgi:hypothetical protein
MFLHKKNVQNMSATIENQEDHVGNANKINLSPWIATRGLSTSWA